MGGKKDKKTSETQVDLAEVQQIQQQGLRCLKCNDPVSWADSKPVGTKNEFRRSCKCCINIDKAISRGVGKKRKAGELEDDASYDGIEDALDEAGFTDGGGGRTTDGGSRGQKQAW